MIDHEKVKKGLECCLHSSKSHCDKCPYIYESLCSINYCTADLASDVLDLLKENPDIVRCKDCKNWIAGYITDKDEFIPPKCGKYQQMVGHSNDDFCNLAERR